MILIVDLCYKKGSLSKSEFVNPVIDIVSRKKQYVLKHFLELREEDILRADKIILCGTALMDNEFIKYIKKFSWIEDIDRYILGICAGMEIICLIFGGKLKEKKEIGMTEIFIKRNDPIFRDIKEFSAYELHNYSIEVPEKFSILAESNNSIQIIKHEEKKIYGIMFHPEVRNKEIISNFLDL